MFKKTTLLTLTLLIGLGTVHQSNAMSSKIAQRVFWTLAGIGAAAVGIYALWQLFQEPKKPEHWAKEDLQENRLWREDIFEHVMGISEREFQESVFPHGIYQGLDKFPLLKAIIEAGGDATVKSTQHPNGIDINDAAIAEELKKFPQRYIFLESRLVLETLGDLQTKMTKLQKKTGTQGSIDLIDGYALADAGNIEEALRCTDVRYRLLEAKKDRQRSGKYFASQIASNWNMLEGGMGKITSLLMGMQHRATNGEHAVLSAIVAAIIRKLLLFAGKIPGFGKRTDFTLLAKLPQVTAEDGGNLTSIGNITEQDANNVLIAGHINVPISSGYYPLYINTKDLSTIRWEKNWRWDQKYERDLGPSKDRAQYMFDTGIVQYGRNPMAIFNSRVPLNTREECQKVERVTQIFASALNINQWTNKKAEAKILNKAQNIGTILFAAVHGIDELDMTLLGCGSFGAHPQETINALSDSRVIAAIAKTGMKVHVVLFPELVKAKAISTPTWVPEFRKQIQAINQKIGTYSG